DEGPVELRDHVGGRAGGRHEAPPGVDGEALQRRGHGGHVGQGAAALGGGDGDGLELAGADVGRRGGEVVEVEVDLARQQRELGRVAAVVRDVHGEDAGLLLEHLAGQVPCAAVAAAAVVELRR